MSAAYHPIVAEPRAHKVNAVLAPIAPGVQATGMTSNTPSPAAGGFPIAVGAIGGTIVGVVMRQPTIGFLTGLIAGIAVAVVIWLRGR